MKIYLLNQSTVLPALDDSTLSQIAGVLQRQLYEHYAPFWQSEGVPVLLAPDLASVPPDLASVPLVLLNDPDQADVLGYHATGPDGRPYARAFVGPLLAHGGTLTTGPFSLSVTLSHECLELVGDPYVLWWADEPNGVAEEAIELCDRVEADCYAIEGIDVSNFLGPRAFGGGSEGPYDWMRLLARPEEVRPGGYRIERAGGPGGPVELLYGLHYPEWKKPGKAHPAARTAKRRRGAAL